MNKKRQRIDYREHSLTVPLTAQEKEKVRAVADAYGMPIATYVRMLLKKEIEEN